MIFMLMFFAYLPGLIYSGYIIVRYPEARVRVRHVYLDQYGRRLAYKIDPDSKVTYIPESQHTGMRSSPSTDSSV